MKFRKLPQPQEGLRALEAHAPHLEDIASRLVEKIRPQLLSLYQIRRKLATTFVAVFTVWLFAHIMFGANGMVVYRQKKTEFQGLQQDVDHLQKENDSYSARIKALKTDPKTIEQEAREQLHYVRPGEVVYVSPAPSSPQKPMLDSARK